MTETTSERLRLEMRSIPSAPETELSPEIAAELPAAASAAPWSSQVDAMLWFHRATSQARALLPGALAKHAGAPITIGGIIFYRSGPVGRYAEIFGTPVMVQGGLS